MRMALYCCVFLLLLVCLAPRVGQNQTHNPKVARSNRAPATTGAARPNLKAPFFLSVAQSTMLPPSLVNCRITGLVPSWEQIRNKTAADRFFPSTRTGRNGMVREATLMLNWAVNLA